jgi:hypothetical protein
LEKSGGLWGSGLLCGLKRADGWAHWRIPRGGFLRFHHSNGGVHLSVRLQCATCPRQVRRPPQCPRTRLIVCKTVRLCTCTLHFDRSRRSTAMLLHQPSSYRLFCDREYMDSRTQAPCSRVTLQLNLSVVHLNSVGTVKARLNAIPTPASTAFATAP